MVVDMIVPVKASGDRILPHPARMVEGRRTSSIQDLLMLLLLRLDLMPLSAAHVGRYCISMYL